MALIINRINQPSHAIELLKILLTIIKRFMIVWFVGAAFYLWIISPKKISSVLLELTGDALVISEVIYEDIFGWINYLSQVWIYLQNLRQENIELRIEVEQLRREQNNFASLHAENTALKQLLSVVPEDQRGYAVAKLLSVTLNPFSQAAVVLAGSKHGVQIDQIVVNDEGLVGRVIEVSSNYSRVMLITDINSRIPITILSSRDNGILAGDGDITKVLYLPPAYLIQKGEKVVTSGDGNIYPKGIAVGSISKITEDAVFVAPIVDLSRTEFVKILFSYKE